ncbi:unnamed protein product [Paramecium sonneborni]|uniref:Uncharacterized protein n=1 Tax=Paramecium sonneborni TaxID=65129 RepID=A0A8S1R333_9CILI|nr:unnamed protein product [Paramecium sonneborni]
MIEGENLDILLKQNSKYKDNYQNNKNIHIINTSLNIIKSLMNRVSNNQDRFLLESRSGFQSQSIFDSCQSLIDVDSFQKQFLLKPSTCSEKRLIKFKSIHQFENL